ncbi:MAG: hypothetical protein HYS21_04740 [Deltaproteobacteria bacterium]|nr:hypothetical protein [Deltaproteobacteria bacterium]
MWYLIAIRLFIGALLMFFAVEAQAKMESQGLISVDDYFSKGTDTAYNRHMLTARLRLDLAKLNQEGTLSFHFDGRERVNFGSLKGSGKNERIDALNIEYEKPKLYLALGRLWPKEVPIETLDGVNLVLKKANSGVGFFGGLKPDPYSEVFTTDYTTLGTYVYYIKDNLNANLAFAHNSYKGATDRQYVYGQVSYTLSKLMLYSTLTMDYNKLANKVNLTNGVIELTYTPDFTRSISIGYNQFRAIQLQKSQAFTVDDSRTRAYYLSGTYRIREKYSVYGRAERQVRDVTDADREYRNSNSYRIGLNTDDIFKTNINMSLSMSMTDGYGSKHNSYNIELSRLNWDVLQVVLNAAYMQNLYGSVNSDNVIVYGASGYWYVNKTWNASLSYEREEGREYSTNRLMTRVTSKF